MKNEEIAFIVPEVEKAIRIDRAVAEYWQRERSDLPLSRSQIQQVISSEQLRVNSKVIKKSSHLVKAGDKVEFLLVPVQTQTVEAESHELDVVYEDKYLMVVNKPAGMAMHPGAGIKKGTLANAVAGKINADLKEENSDRPGIVHRLDKDTTGLVVIAKSVQVHAALAAQFSARTTGRKYTALCFSTPRSKNILRTNDSGTVNAPIGRHPTQRKLMSIVQQGRNATTNWSVVERMSYAALVELKLETGRTHQIRVHMQSIGAPVIGDPVYGDFSALPLKLKKAAEQFGRQALHAATLEFDHPVTKKRLSFTAQPPKDFEDLIEVFRGFAV